MNIDVDLNLNFNLAAYTVVELHYEHHRHFGVALYVRIDRSLVSLRVTIKYRSRFLELFSLSLPLFTNNLSCYSPTNASSR